MRKLMVAGNWKMHGSRSRINDLTQGICQGAANLDQVDWVVLPAFVYIDQVAQALQGSQIAYGGQNLSNETQGAFTGEVSGVMLKDIGCQYVLVGHSERRQLFAETDEMVAAKFVAAQAAQLMPILCVGETLVQREKGQTEQIVSQQIKAVIGKAGVDAFNQAVIAYEPVWAIGTGKSATADEAQTVHQAIRELIAAEDATLAKSLRILYGGSVKRENATELFAMNDIDGGLIGGASLDAEHFLAIGRAGKASLCNS